MDAVGVGVLIGVGTMIGCVFLFYVQERCERQEPIFRPLVQRPKPRFLIRSLLSKSSISHHTQDTLQTSSSVHLQNEFA